MIGASVLLWIMAVDGRIGLFDGLLLTGGVLAYTAFAVRQGRKDAAALAETRGPHSDRTGGWFGYLPAQIAVGVVGLALLVLGADWLVDGAVQIARALGVSDVIVGLTIVAAGTSLPELATSAVATIRGERDIAVGNVIGSCLFNLLAIGGLAALVTPGGLVVAASLIRFDIPVMFATALACLPIFARGHFIARWEGVMFLAYYLAYLLYLILATAQHDGLPVFSAAMLGFVLPLTVATLIVLLVRHRETEER